jgi:hypothetical protein
VEKIGIEEGRDGGGFIWELMLLEVFVEHEAHDVPTTACFLELTPFPHFGQ